MNPHNMDCKCPEHNFEEKLRIATEALEFYADTFNIIDYCKRIGPSSIEVDETVTNKAREALEKIK